MLIKHVGRQLRPIPLRDYFGKGSRFRLRTLVLQQFVDCGLNLPGRVFGFRNPDRKAEPLETGEVGDLLHLHADADNGFTRQRCGHDGSDASVNDGEIRHLVDLKRRNPVRDEDVGGNADSGYLAQLKLHRSNHAVGFAFKALNDFGDDLGRAGASHCEIDQRLIPRNAGEFRREREFILRNEGAGEIVSGRQFDPGKLGRLRDQRNVAAPELEDRIIARNPEMFCCPVDGIEESDT